MHIFPSALSFVALVSLGGCTPSTVRVKHTPPQATDLAEARLVDRHITLDAAGRRPDQVRTAHFCYKTPDRQGQHWDRSFTDTRPGPIGFVIEGPMSDQDTARTKCPQLFQATIQAVDDPERPGEGAAFRVDVAWWRLHNPKCAPIGDPLLGQMRCDYVYRGAQPADNARGFFMGLLKGL
ncbi:MAG: hypothetical protein ACE366_25765 [Bradymonadia bacterium]